MSRTRAPTMPVAVIPGSIEQAYSDLPYVAHSRDYYERNPFYSTTPAPPRNSTHDGTFMRHKPLRSPTIPMPTPNLHLNGSFGLPTPAASPAERSAFYLNGHCHPAARPHTPDNVFMREGNQCAEPDSMADDMFGSEYPPPLMGPRLEQSPFPHDHSHKPRRQDSHGPHHANAYSTPPPTPPNENCRPYDQRHPPAQATSYSYSPDYNHVYHPHTPHRHPTAHASAFPNSHSPTTPPPPPLRRPTSIAQSASWPIGAINAHNRAWTFGAPLLQDDYQRGGQAPSFPTAKVEPPSSSAGRRPERKGAFTSATLPSPLKPTPVFIGQRSPASFMHSAVEHGNYTIFEEPEEVLDGPLDGSNGTATSPEKGISRALMVGINYTRQSGSMPKLYGCVNDVLAMGPLLIDQGYPKENIRTLTDDADDPRQWPTKENILAQIAWLVQGAKANDRLFFHFSGHGVEVKDEDGDEMYGFDDAIVPLDYETEGYILDDELNSRLVKQIPKGCRLTTLVDACHSGTSMDLPYSYSNNENCTKLIPNIDERNVKIKGTEADVVSFSSCGDKEMAEDINKNQLDVGAMTAAFIEAFRDGLTYRQFFNKIGRLMKDNRRAQEPQLGLSHEMNLDAKFKL